jgi:hypothetical protein
MTAAAADRIAGALLGLFVASTVIGFVQEEPAAVLIGSTFGTVGVLASALLFASTLPAVAGTWGLLLRRGWGRPMAGISALLALPTFPVGTVFGVGILGFIGWAWSLERG